MKKKDIDLILSAPYHYPVECVFRNAGGKITRYPSPGVNDVLLNGKYVGKLLFSLDRYRHPHLGNADPIDNKDEWMNHKGVVFVESSGNYVTEHPLGRVHVYVDGKYNDILDCGVPPRG